jgi:hypothetical protein
MPTALSEILRNMGFWPTGGKFAEDWPTRPEERGTFSRAEIDGTRKTFAVDENGVRWEADYRVDLRKYGFHLFGVGKATHLLDGFRMIWHHVREAVRPDIGAELLFLCLAVRSLVGDVLIMLFVPRTTREHWDEREP